MGGVSQAKITFRKEKFSVVNFFLPEGLCHALRARKRLLGHCRRGTRQTSAIRDPSGPQISIGKWWNTRMAAQRFPAA